MSYEDQEYEPMSEPIGTCPVCYEDVFPDEEHVNTPPLEQERFMHTGCVPDHMADELIRPLRRRRF